MWKGNCLSRLHIKGKLKHSMYKSLSLLKINGLLYWSAHTHTHTHTRQLFDKVRSENPAALGKVVPILGDITEPGLGIGEADLELLKENVSIVFHLAATIKFDAPLR